MALSSEGEGARAIGRADPKCTSFCKMISSAALCNTDHILATLHSVIRQAAIKSVLAGMQECDDEKAHIEGREILLRLSARLAFLFKPMLTSFPGGRPKISMDDVHKV
jgi:hypothetical protein